MRPLRESLGLALRMPLDRLQLPGTRIVVDRLMGRSDGTIEVRLATGVRMRLDLADRIQRLEAFRAYERRELSLVRSMLQPGDVVFDVGAHVGYYTLHAAAIVGAIGAVHAFEAAPANAKRLRENVALNNFMMVTVDERAVGAEAGRKPFGVIGIEGESGWSSLLVAEEEAAKSIEVEVVTLDGYSASAGVDRASLIKIDVQGNELDVLRGARGLLEATGPDIISEITPFWLDVLGQSVPEFLSFLRDLGYNAWGVPARGPAVPLHGNDLPSLNLFFTRRSSLERP